MELQILETFLEKIYSITNGWYMCHPIILQNLDKDSAMCFTVIYASIHRKLWQVFPMESFIKERFTRFTYLTAHLTHVVYGLVDECTGELVCCIYNNIALAFDDSFFYGHRNTFGYQQTQQVYILQALPAKFGE